MAQQEEFLPACPLPLVIQPHERIEKLKEHLKEPKFERQRTNILALIRMYETGELGPLTTGHTIYVCAGKIIDNRLIPENLPPTGCAIWSEVSLSPPPLYFRIPYHSSRELLCRFLCGLFSQNIHNSSNAIVVYGGNQAVEMELSVVPTGWPEPATDVPEVATIL